MAKKTLSLRILVLSKFAAFLANKLTLKDSLVSFENI